MEPQMFFRGLRFWHLCIISLLEPPVFHQKRKKQKALGKLYKHSMRNSSKMLLPLNDKQSSAAQRGASRAPWSLLHLLLFTASLCSPCSISSDITSIPASPVKGAWWGGGASWSRASLSDAVCVWACAWRRIAEASAQQSTYETVQPSMKSPLFSLKRAYMDF